MWTLRSTRWLAGGLLAAIVALVLWLSWPAGDASEAESAAAAQRCGGCHAPETQAWSGSHHARAEAWPVPEGHPPRARVDGQWVEAVGVIGVAPLVQYLVAGPRGRVQVTTDAWDVAAAEWFDTLEAPVASSSWSHHRGGGNNWNRSCAECHATGVEPGYDAATDTWDTDVAAHGVTCAACHPADDHPDGGEPVVLAPEAMAAVCDRCHARRADLTGAFTPGSDFFDHFVPQGVDGRAHHVDGQIRDEVFETVAFWGSAMHAAGVTCVACHEPHSGALLASGDGVCAQCHPTDDHGHHAPDDAGCIDCHMPVTTYMQRHPRHDHGLFVPDAVLGEELGLPHACDRCHDDDVRAAYRAWWPDAGRDADRARLRTWAGAARGDEAYAESLAALLRHGAPGRRAAAATLAGPLAPLAVVRRALRDAALDADPRVRLAAVQTLGASGDPSVEAALRDDRRSVRVAAALALGAAADGTTAGDERDRYLERHLYHPDVRVQRGALARSRGDLDEALADARAARVLDPGHGGAARLEALVWASRGRPSRATELLRARVAAAPDDAEAWALLGVAQAETGDRETARRSLAQVASTHPRAARDLGLLAAADGDHREAARWLFVAVELAPFDPELHYALATVLRDWGRRAEARAAAHRLLQLAPDHPGGRALLVELQAR